MNLGVNSSFQTPFEPFYLQNNPVDVVQPVVPQVQALEFAILPSVIKQGGPVEQLLLDTSQNRPVESVHSVVPHTQPFVFAIDPLVTMQLLNGAS